MSIEETKVSEGPSLLDKISYSIRGLLLDYKRSVIFFIPLLLVILFMVFKFSLLKSKAERDVISAKAAYSKWVSSDNLDTIHLQTLKNILKKRPELSPAYEGPIIQKLVASSQVSQAKLHVESILKRIGRRCTYYTRFSQSSLRIAQNDHATALQKAIKLKEDMILDKPFWERQSSYQYGSTLFAFNLLRIAMLNQELDHKEDELIAWKELKKYAKWDQIDTKSLPLDLDPLAFDRLLSHLTDQKLSLKDYIRYRESKLIAQMH